MFGCWFELLVVDGWVINRLWMSSLISSKILDSMKRGADEPGLHMLGIIEWALTLEERYKNILKDIFGVFFHFAMS